MAQRPPPRLALSLFENQANTIKQIKIHLELCYNLMLLVLIQVSDTVLINTEPEEKLKYLDVKTALINLSVAMR